MSKRLMILLLAITAFGSVVTAQEYRRKLVQVPKVDPAALTIDGVMNEAAWATAAKANMITASGFEIYTNKYYREALSEPDYDEMVGHMLWAKDTLYVFVHIDEFVNDSTDLYWNGKWTGDQLFIGLSNRLAMNMKGWYDGNVYAAPDGPYHFLVLGNDVTLNNGEETYIPDEFMRFPEDTTRIFDAGDIARWGVTMDMATGVWNVEMAIYNPAVTAQGRIGFNLGGSTGSYVADTTFGDAYAYYCWQPSVVDSPYAQPPGVEVPSWGGDPGFYNLANSNYWALLEFAPGVDDYTRKLVDVPMVDPAALTIDGFMNEAAWATAAKANMITASGFEIYTNKYYREALSEPDYDEMVGSMLWAKDTLYVFMHIDEFVNDSTDLYWNGKWTGDQLFIGLSNRLAMNMKGWYDGNVYAAPDGPYHFLVLGNVASLNNGEETYIPDEFMRFPEDTTRFFDAGDIARWGVTMDMATGVWNVEMAIYNPNVAEEARLGFNIGGSTGSYVADTTFGDAYAYYCWQPSVVDSPYAQPPGVEVPSWGGDPGFYNLANSNYWPLLTFKSSGVVSVDDNPVAGIVPDRFSLDQNYPNPFNPSTTIRYSVPKATRVTLNVFNVLGQRVETLVDAERAAGTYSVTWSAVRQASGIYFYELRADGNVIATRKMMFLK